MDDLELCYLPAIEALRSYRSKELSPLELLQALIRRTEAVEPQINAFTECYFEEALDQAARAEARYVAGNARPLEGLPIAIKDEPEIRGKITTQGSLLFKDYVSEESAYVVDRLAEAGAIFHARTATPEFCLIFQTFSRLGGVTRNPWNLDITPGGSSGGSAASLAAGTSTLASGSDIGGSIRQPASMCGLVGYKPPYGRNPEAAPYNLDPWNHQGPLARTVADCALFQNLMSGPHPHDIATVRPKAEIPLAFDTNLSGWRIAYSIDLDYVEVDPEVVRNTEEILEIFRSLGAYIEPVKLGWTDRVDQAALRYYEAVMGDVIDKVAGEGEELLTDYARDYLERGRSVRLADYFESLRVCGEMYESFGPLMERYQLFVCPTTTTTRVAMCHQFNMISRCPVLSVPSGISANRVPTGVQLVGRTFDDESVFRAAAALEAARPPFCSASDRPVL